MSDSNYRIDREIWPDTLPRGFEFYKGKRPLHEYIRTHAAEQGDKGALQFYGNSLSWSDVDKKVEAFAQSMRYRGYEKGDVCALHVQNCPQFFIAYHGAHRAGMVVTPLNPQYKGPALRHQLRDNGAEIVITHPDLIETLREVQDETAVEDVVTIQYKNYTGNSGIPVHKTVRNEAEQPDNTILFSELTTEPSTEIQLPSVDIDDLALLQYTGGTTGLPKGCKHTHWNILYKSTVTHRVYQYQPEETHLAVMPIFHVAGKLLYVDTPVITGLTTTFLTRYRPEDMMAAVDEYDATLSYFTVPMANEIITHEQVQSYDLTSLSDFRDVNYTSSLGTSLTKEISDKWEEQTGARLQETAYGLSETHTMDTHTVGETRIEPEKGTFTGQPTYGVEIEIRDFESNKPLARGEQGEIVIRTPSTMTGYLERPEATEEVLEDDGFLHTGDIGKWTKEGYLYFLGREKDVIKVSGHTVSPREIENILESDDRIEDAVAVGKPHETRGRVIEVHVIADESVTTEDVIALADENLAEYKVPKSVVFTNSLPRTDIGKVDRVAFRERLPEGYE